MATLADINAEVLRIVEDQVSVVTAAITTHVQRAQRAIEDRVKFRVQQATTTFVVDTPTQSYTLPTDFIGAESAPHFLAKSTSTQYSFLDEVEEFEPLGLPTVSTGPPKYWRLEAENSIQFWPLGDGEGPSATTAGAYDVIFPYYKRLSTLTIGTDTNWWTENMDDVLAWKATSLVFAEMRDPMAGFWGSIAAARFKEIVSQNKRNLLRQRGSAIYPDQNLSAGASRSRLRRQIKTTLP